MRRTVNVPTLPLMDLKIEEAWAMGYTGKGVVLSVIDDGMIPLVKLFSTFRSFDIGLEHNHTDLMQNYVCSKQ